MAPIKITATGVCSECQMTLTRYGVTDKAAALSLQYGIKRHPMTVECRKQQEAVKSE